MQEKAAGAVVAELAEERSRRGVRDEEALAGARQRDVGEPALFLELVFFTGREPLVGKDFVLHARQKDRAKFEALRAVYRHERETRYVLHLVDVGRERHALEVAGQSRFLAGGLRLYLVLRDRADELGQVLQPRVRLRRVLVLERYLRPG